MRLSSSQTALTAKPREGKRPNPVVFAAPDVVLDACVPAVTDLQELGGAAAGAGGVGEEHLMPQALVLVEQGELGSGVRALAAHDDAGVGRVAVQVDHAGQLGDLGAVTQCPVLVQGGMPEAVGYGPEGAALRLQVPVPPCLAV